MTQMISGIDALEAAMAGPVLSPGHPDYDEARSLFNGDIDRHPAAIARCTVGGRRRRGDRLRPRPRRGDRGTRRRPRYAGTAVAEAGLMIDLSPLNRVTVDPGPRRGSVRGGTSGRPGRGDPGARTRGSRRGDQPHRGGRAHARRRNRLAQPQAGLEIDNLVSARDRARRRARSCGRPPTENPDLHWALRGGGGNFGVVTEFEFELHPVGPKVQLGMFFWGLDQGAEMLRFVRDYLPTLPQNAGALLAAG